MIRVTVVFIITCIKLDQVTIEPIKLWSQSLPIGNVDLGVVEVVVVVEVDLGVVVFFLTSCL